MSKDIDITNGWSDAIQGLNDKEQQTREEKVIDGVLHFRTFPTRAWKPYPIKYLTHELLENRKDAERYRWLRENIGRIQSMKPYHVFWSPKPEELDEAIDNEIRED